MSRTNRKEVSPSKRLRNILFTLWKQDKEGYRYFEDYYNHNYSKIIKHYKSKIKS